MLSVKDGLQFSILEDPSACSAEWDDFVAAQHGHIFQTTQWARYKQRVGWNPLFLSWSTDGRLRAICLVMHRSVASLPMGGILYAPRGPVLDYNSPEAPHLFSEILARLVHLARRKLAVVRVSPDVEHTVTWVPDKFSSKEFNKAKRPVQHTTTLRVSLKPPISQIISDMEKGRRYLVRRFEKDGQDWLFDNDNSLENLKTFYSLYSQTISNADGEPKSLKDMCIMHDTLAPHDFSFVFTASYQNHPVSGAEIVAVGKRLWYLYGGSAKGDDAASGAGIFLHWEIIKWAKEQGYAEYDLQGIPDEIDADDPLHGIYLFKRRWGGERVLLTGEYDYSPYPLLGRLLDWNISRLGS